MKIEKLRFKNLNSLKGEWEIDFQDPMISYNGIFTISGPTASGKTTILDAICLGLYGKTPRLKAISGSENNIMSMQTGECFSEVVFSVPEGQFRCHWSQRRSKGQADGKLQQPKFELAEMKTGTIRCAKLSECEKSISEITGMSFLRFSRSLLLAQGQFAAFLSSSQGDRAMLLEQITGTEIYSEISKNIFETDKIEKEKLNKIRQEINTIEGYHTTDESDDNEGSFGLAAKSQVEEQIVVKEELLQKSQRKQALLTQYCDDFQWLENSVKTEKEYLVQQENLTRLLKTQNIELDALVQQEKYHASLCEQQKFRLEQWQQNYQEFHLNQNKITDGESLLQSLDDKEKLKVEAIEKLDEQQQSHDRKLKEYKENLLSYDAVLHGFDMERFNLCSTFLLQKSGDISEIIDELQGKEKVVLSWVDAERDLSWWQKKKENVRLKIQQLKSEYDQILHSLFDYGKLSREIINRQQEIEQKKELSQQLGIDLEDQQKIIAQLDATYALFQRYQVLTACRNELHGQDCPLCGNNAYEEQSLQELSERATENLDFDVVMHEEQIQTAHSRRDELDKNYRKADTDVQLLDQRLKEFLNKRDDGTQKIEQMMEAYHRFQDDFANLYQDLKQICCCDLLPQKIAKENWQAKSIEELGAFYRSLNNCGNLYASLEQWCVQLDLQLQKAQEQQESLSEEMRAEERQAKLEESFKQTWVEWKEKATVLMPILPALSVDFFNEDELDQNWLNIANDLSLRIDLIKNCYESVHKNRQESDQISHEIEVLNAQRKTLCNDLEHIKELRDKNHADILEAENGKQRALNKWRESCPMESSLSNLDLQAQEFESELQEGIEQSSLSLKKKQGELDEKRQQKESNITALAQCQSLQQQLTAERQEKEASVVQIKTTLQEECTTEDTDENTTDNNLLVASPNAFEKLSVLEKQRVIWGEQETEIVAELNQLRENLGQIKDKEKWEEKRKLTLLNLEKAEQEQQKIFNDWALLNDLIGSADGKKYRNFVQSLTLDQVLKHANKQLMQISDRYLLMRGNDKKSQLEILLVDYYQGGKIRACSNVSGGESFLISLSLALGLAQMQKRNIPIDTLFIDEGFGTLDEETLEVALETLLSLQQRGKMIGLISHVAILKDRIPTRIEIVPNNGISTIVGPGVKFLSSNGT